MLQLPIYLHLLFLHFSISYQQLVTSNASFSDDSKLMLLLPKLHDTFTTREGKGLIVFFLLGYLANSWSPNFARLPWDLVVQCVWRLSCSACDNLLITILSFFSPSLVPIPLLPFNSWFSHLWGNHKELVRSLTFHLLCNGVCCGGQLFLCPLVSTKSFLPPVSPTPSGHPFLSHESLRWPSSSPGPTSLRPWQNRCCWRTSMCCPPESLWAAAGSWRDPRESQWRAALLAKSFLYSRGESALYNFWASLLCVLPLSTLPFPYLLFCVCLGA